MSGQLRLAASDAQALTEARCARARTNPRDCFAGRVAPKTSKRSVNRCERFPKRESVMKSGFRVTPLSYLTLLLQVVLLTAATRLPGAAQSQQTEQQFIDSTSGAIAAFQATLPTAPNNKVVLGGNLLYANGAFYLLKTPPPLDILLEYVEGLKAAGAQRVDLNPAVTSINNPAATAAYDALVAHIRELGMQLALNPQVAVGELGSSPSFQDFQDMAMTTYPALAARYQPENFVIVHEPTTMNARLGVTASVADWDSFIRAVAPLIHAASPHTRLGGGASTKPTKTHISWISSAFRPWIS
jgi:hypothetical protein